MVNGCFMFHRKRKKERKKNSLQHQWTFPGHFLSTTNTCYQFILGCFHRRWKQRRYDTRDKLPFINERKNNLEPSVGFDSAIFRYREQDLSHWVGKVTVPLKNSNTVPYFYCWLPFMQALIFNLFQRIEFAFYGMTHFILKCQFCSRYLFILLGY